MPSEMFSALRLNARATLAAAATCAGGMSIAYAESRIGFQEKPEEAAAWKPATASQGTKFKVFPSIIQGVQCVHVGSLRSLESSHTWLNHRF